MIHAVRLETRIHREPTEAGYRLIEDLSSSEELAPIFAPELAVKLCELELT